MKLLRHGAILTTLFFVCAPAQAGVLVQCGGYNPAINDHVEWEIRINGKPIKFEGEIFKVSETKGLFVLTSPRSQIRIDRRKKRYVIFDLKRTKVARVEWSRNVPGEGCDFSR